jgi:hypothetical protein
MPLQCRNISRPILIPQRYRWHVRVRRLQVERYDNKVGRVRCELPSSKNMQINDADGETRTGIENVDPHVQ